MNDTFCKAAKIFYAVRLHDGPQYKNYVELEFDEFYFDWTHVTNRLINTSNKGNKKALKILNTWAGNHFELFDKIWHITYDATSID